MRPLLFAIVFLVSTKCAFALDISVKERAKLLEPVSTKLTACLSDVVDRAKAQGMTSAEFKEALPQSCPNEWEEFRKALLEGLVPALKADDSKGREFVTWATQFYLLPFYNEFLGRIPYRYRMKDAEKAKTPTLEDIAFESVKEGYFRCLSTFAANSKASGAPADDFKNSLDRACIEEAEAVRQAELRIWETYANPPSNRKDAGKIAITRAKITAARQYNEASK